MSLSKLFILVVLVIVTVFASILADYIHKNICPALRLHHENADEKPRVGYHVQPHRAHQRTAVQQRGVGSAHDGGVSSPGHHGHGPSLHDGKLPC